MVLLDYSLAVGECLVTVGLIKLALLYPINTLHPSQLKWSSCGLWADNEEQFVEPCG